MCVIIHKPKGVEIPEKFIKNSLDRNRDGFGYMYFDEQEGRIKSGKLLAKNVSEIMPIVERLKDHNAAFHFRIMTHGKVAVEQCHPFKVLDKHRNGMDMFFMHNGVITDVKWSVDESDTMAFNREILKPLLKVKPSMFWSTPVCTLIKSFVGTSKLLFFYGSGKVHIINKQAGVERDGLWASNTSPFYEPYVAPPSAHNTHRGGFHNRNSPFAFLGVDTDVGDKVYVYHKTDYAFEMEGSVNAVNKNCLWAYVDLPGGRKDMSFSCVTGEGIVDTGYFAIPELNADTRDVMTLGDVRKSIEEDDKKKVTPKQNVVVPLLPTSSQMVTCLTKQDHTLKATEDSVGTPIDVKKKDPDTLTRIDLVLKEHGLAMTAEEALAIANEESKSSVSEDTVKTSVIKVQEDDLMIQIDGLKVHSKEGRYGGGCIDTIDLIDNPYGSEDENEPNITIRDLYFMTPQERVDMAGMFPFLHFAIFNDLIEKAFVDWKEADEDEKEYGEYADDDDEDFDDDEDDEVTTDPRPAQGMVS